MRLSSRWIVFCAALCLAPISALADTTYTYQGDPFTTADPPYTTSDRVVGNFSLSVPLAPSLPLTPIPGVVRAFSFSDGVQTLTRADSTICAFSVATDAQGDIIEWAISLREAPASAPGDPQRVLDSATVGDAVGEGPADATPCGTISLSTVALNASGGTWTTSLPGTPTVYDYTGTPFTLADPPWTVGDLVSGSVVFSDVLPPLVVDQDLSFALLSFIFVDGVQTRDETNSAVCSFVVSTDTTGTIVAWTVALREAPVPAVGNPQRALATTSTPGISDQAGELPANPMVCGDGVLSPLARSSATGTWSGPTLPPSPTTYTYEGQPFTTAQPPFAVGQRIVGSIELPAPLPANLPPTDITHSLDAMTFEDGVQIRDLGNSDVCSFEVETNSAGEIVEWSVSLREAGVAPSNPMLILDTVGAAAPTDQSGIAPAPPGLCEQISVNVAGRSLVAGTWRGSGGFLPIPTLGEGALLTLATLIGLGGIAVMRRRRTMFVG